MGTTAAVSAPAGQSARVQRLRETVGVAFAEIERDLSIFLTNSVLNAVNAAAGDPTPVPVNSHVAAVLRHALDVAKAGGGAFDPTVGPLMTLWGFRSGSVTHSPAAAAITETLERVGWQHVRLDLSDPAAPAAALARPGMRLDLGGIAKGYAVDLAYDRLRAASETDFLINLGGNLRAHGVPGAGRTGWGIGVRDPFHGDRILGTVQLREGEATATSGNYERFVVLDGVRYAHIIDPRSGRPVTGVAGVTVIAPTAMQADALSTTLFVLGPEAGLRLLATVPGCQALWVLDEQPVRTVASPGFRMR
jgi:thiamine biosynthesis lipoprotein